MSAQLQSLTTVPHVHKSPNDFWCAQTCSFQAIFGLPMTIAASAIQQRVKKTLYRCTFTFSALKYCGGINLSAIYMKWCAQTFLQILEF